MIDGLAQLGVLGMTAPTEFGGRGFSQLGYTQDHGGHRRPLLRRRPSSSTPITRIGIRALLLFGTEEQKRRWLPDLVSGRKLAAFALTEPEAGSDAANVQTTATPSADGKTYILNGEKRYITNGGIAQVLTVMARTPVPGSSETKVTAFLVTPDMPGFEVVEARMDKCGIRGTATARLAFHNMPVPAENILGQLGKGLRVALTVLDFGRTTFGASCTGAAKTCLQAAVAHANKRVQFKQPLGEFELVKKKIAFMAANAFAMEATTTQCAAFIDRGAEDYMLETAMLKVWSTEALWTIVNDTLQIYGGQGYFTRRALRTHDARRPHQHDRRRGQRRAQGVHRRRRHARRRRAPQGRARRAHASALANSARSGALAATSSPPASRRRRFRCTARICSTEARELAGRRARFRHRRHQHAQAFPQQGAWTNGNRRQRGTQDHGGRAEEPVHARAPRRRRLRSLRLELHAGPPRSPAGARRTAIPSHARHAGRPLLHGAGQSPHQAKPGGPVG